MAVRTTLIGGDAGQPGGIEQCGVGRAQRLADQDRAFRQGGEAAEWRVGQVADQASTDLAHLLGPPFTAGAVVRAAVVGRLARDHCGDGLDLVHYRRLGADQAFADPAAHAAGHACGGGEHLDIGVDQRRDLGLGFFGQHGQTGAQPAQLVAGLHEGGVQTGGFGLDLGAVDGAADDFGGRFGGAEHRPDRHPLGDSDAGETPFTGGTALGCGRTCSDAPGRTAGVAMERPDGRASGRIGAGGGREVRQSCSSKPASMSPASVSSASLASQPSARS